MVDLSMVDLNKNPRYRILNLIDTLGTGGAQMIVYQMARLADRDKYEYTACGCLESGYYEELLKENGFAVESVAIKRRSVLLFPLFIYDVLHTIFRLSRIIKKRNIDIIHTHLPDSNIFGAIVGRLLGIPVVITIHNNIIMPCDRTAPLRNWLRKKVIKTTFSQVEALIGVGADIGQSMIDQGHVKEDTPILTILNGVDYDKFAKKRNVKKIRENLDLPLNSKVLSCVSRLENAKGHTYLIEATARLKKKFPLLRVLVVGDGSLLNDLVEQAKQAGVTEQIRFLGRRSDVPDIVAASDIFVLPSLHEGVPLVVLEAMSARKPVVATNIHGTREVVVDGEDGFLVPARDPVSLAKRIDELLYNPDLGDSMGEAARAKVKKRFTAKMMVRNVEYVYQSILEKR